MLSVAHLFLNVALGAVFGLLGGLFGIGGGIVAIPVLGFVFGLSQQAAQGTALVMMVPNVAIGLWRYYQRRSLNMRYAVTLALSAIPFTYAGARVATGLPSGPLRIAFASFTIAIAIYVLWKSFATRSAPAGHAPWYLSSIVGAIGGTLSGFFSVGGATFAVPAMAAFFGLSQAAAQSMGLALVAPGTVVGLATYGAAGDVDWLTGLALAVGGTLAVTYGVDFAHRLPERTLKGFFAVFLFGTALALLAEH